MGRNVVCEIGPPSTDWQVEPKIVYPSSVLCFSEGVTANFWHSHWKWPYTFKLFPHAFRLDVKQTRIILATCNRACQSPEKNDNMVRRMSGAMFGPAAVTSAFSKSSVFIRPHENARFALLKVTTLDCVFGMLYSTDTCGRKTKFIRLRVDGVQVCGNMWTGKNDVMRLRVDAEWYFVNV